MSIGVDRWEGWYAARLGDLLARKEDRRWPSERSTRVLISTSLVSLVVSDRMVDLSHHLVCGVGVAGARQTLARLSR
jgi:hypothetical protein